MPRPSVTWSGIRPETAAASDTITCTVASGDNVLEVDFGGYGGTSVSVTSVELTSVSPHVPLNDVSLYVQNGTAQYSGKYAIFSDNPDWPGAGNHDITVTLDAGGRQLKVAAAAIADVDLSRSPKLNAATTSSGSSSTPSITHGSSNNALNVAVAATYSADIGGGDDTMLQEDQNSTAASSLYLWTEDGAGASDTTEGNASVDWAMCVVSYEGTSSGTTIDGNLESISLTTFPAQLSRELSVATESLTLTTYAASINKAINANLESLTLETFMAQLSADKDISAVLENLTLTTFSANINENFTATPDTFDGTGALGAHWLQYQSSIHEATRVGGYLDIQVDDNTGNQTTWWGPEGRGHMVYQKVKFPTGAIPNEYILINAGVGPTSNPQDNLTSTGNPFNFCGLIVHDANLSNDRYHFAVIGHRGTDAQATIEHKRTYDGSSTQNDEGTDVFGSGVTHGDVAVELHSNGDMLFKRRPDADSDWTYINGGTGLVQGATSGDQDLGTGGDEVLVGIVAYAYTSTGVPFVGTVDSFMAFDQEFDQESITLTTFPATISADIQINAQAEAITLSTFAASLSENTHINANLESLVLTANQAQVSLGTNLQAELEQLTLTVNPATLTKDTYLNTSLESLVLNAFSAQVSLGTVLNTNLESLTITPQGVTITLDTGISATLESLTLETFNSVLTIPTGALDAPGLEYTLKPNLIHFTFKKVQ